MSEVLEFFKEWGIAILSALALLAGGVAIPGLRGIIAKVIAKIVTAFASEKVLVPLAVTILKKLASMTTNKLDDKAVELIEKQLGLDEKEG